MQRHSPDPNRADDEEYIVRLVGQVLRVSLEPVRIVKGPPERYARNDACPRLARPLCALRLESKSVLTPTW